ncbi:hypothetical protein [Halodesulfurarchaeum formicicum]|uniref:hypothetical protein n=1 Tax=Halodesulfurarchaeum formicicum TaxID=1873524 RepID=UPI0009031656|nr:hypothetical protein [Halodesulfurarchaeum formicicum]
MPQRYRYVVLSVFVGLLVVTAGCSGPLSDTDTSRELKLVNQDNTDHAVVVEISDETGLVYSDGRTIEAETDLNLAEFNQTGEFDVKVTVDGNSTTITHTFESTDDAIHVTNIGISNDGTVRVG